VDTSSLAGAESLLQAPAPAVLTTYRRDGTALVSPVWFRHAGDAFEVVIDVSEARTSIASRYLGAEAGARFVAQRTARPGVLLQLRPDTLRVWDLSAILPD
jgi:hypothetical protein